MGIIKKILAVNIGLSGVNILNQILQTWYTDLLKNVYQMYYKN